VVMSAGFFITAAGTQHNALLQRQLRYFAPTWIEGLSELLGVAVGIGMAIGGCTYWALIGTTIVSPDCPYRLSMADCGVDPWKAAACCWDPFPVAFWRHNHAEWFDRLCCLQSREGSSGPLLGRRCPRILRWSIPTCEYADAES
jgi:hypothetical protein